MLITPADHWFSLCIRERAGWKCESCGKQYPELSRGVHCSHFFSRGNWATRLNPDDAFCHCYSCHLRLGSNPDTFVEWAKEKLGNRYDTLVQASNDIVLGKYIKRTKGKGIIAGHFRREYENMLELRAKGVKGRIDFSPFPII